MEEDKKSIAPAQQSGSLDDLIKNTLGGQTFVKKEREPRSSSLDQMRLNLMERVANLGLSSKSKTGSSENTPSSTTGSGCKDHPEEEVQFFSVRNDRTLCSKCLSSGKFSETEAIPLVKATGQIKAKLEGYLQEITKRSDQLAEHQEKLENIKKEINEFASNNKSEIKQGFDELRAALDRKERELLEGVDNITIEKEREIDMKCRSVKENYEEILNMKGILKGKINDLKDADLCQYYVTKEKLIKNFIAEKCGTKSLNSNRITIVDDLQGQYNLSQYQKGISELLESLKNLKGVEQKNNRASEISLLNRNKKTPEKNAHQDSLSESIVPGGTGSVTSIHLNDESVSYLQPRSKSPFLPLRNDLGVLSPLQTTTAKGARSPVEAGESSFIKLFDTVSYSTKDLQGSRSDFKSQSISKLSDIQTHSTSKLSILDSQTQSVSKLQQLEALREKNSIKNTWDNYKNMLEEQNRNRRTLTTSTSQLGEQLEKTKTSPKTYLQEFIRPKVLAGSDMFSTPTRKEFYSSPSQGLSSANLKSFTQTDFSKQSNNSSSSSFLKLQLKRNNNDSFSSSATGSKSFGSSRLSTNLQKFKKQIGLWNDE